VTALARERLPEPQAITGVVVNDFPSRTLFVRLPDLTTGSQRILWQRGHAALVQMEATGFRGNVPDLWAATKDSERVAHAVPVEGGLLKFHFPVGPGSAYSQLISKPRLTAIVTCDRASGYFLRCLFLHSG
jgi:hypothetical protein